MLLLTPVLNTIVGLGMVILELVMGQPLNLTQRYQTPYMVIVLPYNLPH